MASTTDLIGWPFPQSTDKIAEGAVNIEDLADSVQDQFFLASNKFAATESHLSYPQGMSIMAVNNSSGWPYGGIVTTWVRLGSSFVVQWFTWQTSTVSAQKTQIRYGYSTGSPSAPVWSAWKTVASAGSPTAQATGTIVCQMPNTTDRDVQAYSVTFPSGRFATTPRIFLNYGTSAPVQVNVSIGSPSATSVIIYYYRANLTGNGDPVTTATSVYWYAIEGAE